MRPGYGADLGAQPGLSRAVIAAQRAEQERQGRGEGKGPGKHRRMRDGPLEGKHLGGRGQSAQVPCTETPGVGAWRGQ